MEYSYWGEVLLSTLLFAPGLILLGVFAFIDLLTLLEKSGALRAMTFSEPVEIPYEGTTQGENPGPGRVVQGLNEALSAAPASESSANKKTGS